VAYSTTITPLKQQQIINAALGILQREIVLPNLVWLNAAGDFAGALNDTKTFRVPALPTTARTVAIRPTTNDATNRARTFDSLAETSVDVKLTTDIYKGVVIDDEVLSLDISDFGAQVLSPIMQSVAYGVEDMVGTAITGATYATGHTMTYASSLTTRTTSWLTPARSSTSGTSRWTAALSSAVPDAENWILKSDHLNQFEQSGQRCRALRDAQVGRLAGNTLVVSQAIPDFGHLRVPQVARSSCRSMAPKVPRGASVGSPRPAFNGPRASATIQGYDETSTSGSPARGHLRGYQRHQSTTWVLATAPRASSAR
jgi:hypothetical protein